MAIVRRECRKVECPYCLEEVKDEALVCRYCGRDLSLIKLLQPTEGKVAEHERRISVLESQRGEKQPADNTPTVVADNTPTVVPQDTLHGGLWHIAFWAAAMGAVLLPTFAFYVLGVTDNFRWFFLLLMLPLPIGGAAGYFWPGRHRAEYLGAALLVSLAGYATIALIIAAVEGPSGPIYTAVEFGASITVATLFFAGVRFGDLFEKRRRWLSGGTPTHEELRKSPSGKTAARIAKISGSRELSPQVVLAIQALGPASLTLVGTISTTLLTLFFESGGAP